uniref:Uncharacterized protein n=1 Tax=Arundo donax TaxID=35708 RepID=A0A0A9EF55_ARUDO
MIILHTNTGLRLRYPSSTAGLKLRCYLFMTDMTEN